MADTPETPQDATPAAPAPAPERPRPARTPSPKDTYYYDGTRETLHPVLGLIQVGANRWPDASDEVADAIMAMVKKGILRAG